VNPYLAFLDWEGTFGILKYDNFTTNYLNEIFILVKNGFTYSDAIIMPTHIRKYYINILKPKEE